MGIHLSYIRSFLVPIFDSVLMNNLFLRWYSMIHAEEEQVTGIQFSDLNI